MNKPLKQLTITLDSEAVAALERYQSAYREWLRLGLTPQAEDLSAAVTLAARVLAAKVDEAARTPEDDKTIQALKRTQLRAKLFSKLATIRKSKRESTP